MLPHTLLNPVDHFLKNSRPPFGWPILWQERKKSDFLPFSPGELSGVLFLWKLIFHPEKSEESGWIDRYWEVLHRHHVFPSQQGVICSSEFFIFFPSCLETWSRQGPDGFCQLQDGLLSCVTSEAECEHSMQVLAGIEVGCALSGGFNPVLKSYPNWFSESFQCFFISRRPKGSSFCFMGHHSWMQELSSGRCRFQSPRWGMWGLEVPDSFSLGPSYVVEHPPKEIKWIVSLPACMKYGQNIFEEHLSFMLPDQRALLLPWISQSQTWLWLSECWSARFHRDYHCCDFMLIEVCWWWTANIRLALMLNIDTRSPYIIFCLILVFCGNRLCRGSGRG